MKICLKCDKPINEEGEDPYVMIIIKKRSKIMEFICFHFDCWQEQLNNPAMEKVKEKMNSCRVCRKKIGFWDSYMEEGNYFCKNCWEKKEDKLEESRQEKEKERGEKSGKRDDFLNDSQKTL